MYSHFDRHNGDCVTTREVPSERTPCVLLEKRFRELLEAAPDAIMQVDAEGRIILLNRVTEDMFGYTRDELLGQPVEVLIPQELHARHAEHRAHYRQHPMTRTMGSGLALEGIRKDGSRFPVEISLSPSRSAEGFRVTAIIRDTTERRIAEERLRKVREEYTQRLAETNAELEMTNRELERANRLKSEFLASMSHELRTPLHTIIGFSELLAEELEGPLNEKQQRFVQHIHTDSLHLLELINDVLDISKIEADRLELRPEAFDFTALVAESLASVRSLAEAKSHTLETALDVPTAVEADRLRIKQVLVNLLSNAIKFTPEGGRIRLEARVQDAFRRGFRGGHRRRNSPGRARVHLRQVSSGGCDDQGRSRRHGAWAWRSQNVWWNSMAEVFGCKASPSKGSTFSFYASPRNRPDASAEKDSRRMKKVLVADDKATGRELVRTVLENSGHQVFEASDGEQAVAEARRIHPDLIILDIHMPGLDGFGVIEKLRREEGFRRHPDHRPDRQRHDGRSRARHVARASPAISPSPSVSERCEPK